MPKPILCCRLSRIGSAFAKPGPEIMRSIQLRIFAIHKKKNAGKCLQVCATRNKRLGTALRLTQPLVYADNYLISCSSILNSGVLQNSPRVISKTSHNFLIVMLPWFFQTQNRTAQICLGDLCTSVPVYCQSNVVFLDKTDNIAMSCCHSVIIEWRHG